MSHAKSELYPTMIDDEDALGVVEAEMVARLGPAHNMVALNGPQCGCGEPSTHESGWCGHCSSSRPVSAAP